jgi:hypothetical protein
MNFSVLKEEALRYLSPHKMPFDAHLDALVSESFDTLCKLDSFRVLAAEYTSLLPFLKAEPYASFLQGSNGYFLIACTLGVEVDRHLRRLNISDLAHAIVFDACANAYLEQKSEDYKRTLGNDLSYTFCPGYAGSSLCDLSYIFKELKPEKIGMGLTQSGLMLPQKSMAGIIAKGVAPKMRCEGCAKQNDCIFRKEGKRCFPSERI